MQIRNNITWAVMVVTNNGLDTAAGVTIADRWRPATAGVGDDESGLVHGQSDSALRSPKGSGGGSVTITLVTTPSTVGRQATRSQQAL